MSRKILVAGFITDCIGGTDIGLLGGGLGGDCFLVIIEAAVSSRVSMYLRFV